ncbi:MAG: DUF465 domain-containing protein [Nitrospirae bacterium]|nr:DUF465 domain-containing protein [Nitrospirota bacterium]MBI5695985.1 DUF465 domain-containing protein [Nitrospirota bacterium]
MGESEDLIEYARRENEEYARLEKGHRDLDLEIETKFGGKKFLTAEEEIEKKTLQKQKLAKKDRMFQILVELKATVK